ncbi:DUF4175 family protein [Natronogracilivirga saccharolytica]|uniref:DUF4175 domain-containing protein n=1 Tax=Natronogracilivirga saccharolytica TaxID=2812953 RepID=A0A8J7RJ62_9BACT|nr:DUF4175 family protein [Natronogracilivirga saccharolytica]MBP3192202.1 hypothetical protein [Natronogracilivirga saccharolytica]
MSQHPDLTRIEAVFRSVHGVLRRRRRLTAGLAAISAAIGMLILFLIVEQAFYLPPLAKIVSWVAVAGAGAAAGWLLHQKLHLPGFQKFYRKTADETGMPGLRHALDIINSSNEGTSGLTDAAIQQNLQQITGQNPDERLNAYLHTHPVSRYFRWSLTISASSALIFLGAIFLFSDALYRSSTFWASYQPPIPYEFTITPGDTTIEQGSSFQVSVRFDGDVPEQVRMGIRSGQESESRLQGMTRGDDGSFVSRETDLFEDSEYFVDMDGFRSERKNVRVELLPRLQDFKVTTHPPEYTGMDSETHSYPFNRVETVKGSEISITTRKNKPLSSISLIAENSGDTLSVSPDTLMTAGLTAESDERFHFAMEDEYGLRNSNPFRFRLSVIEDQAPRVEILSPESRVEDFVGDMVPLLYEYEDDFGFTGSELNYRLHKAFVDKPVEGSIDLGVPENTSGMAEFDWDVSDMGLGPMDRLEYWVEVTDNNEISGYQTSRSSTHVIEIPSLASRFFEQDEKESDFEDRFSEVEQSHRRMQDDLEQLREEIRTNPDDEWEQSQMLEDISDQRSDIEQQLEDLKREFDELTRDMEQQDMMSDETVERYRELQQLMDEIDDPEILKLLEEMQENLGNFDQSQLREQIDNIEFSEEKYRERLERTLELFKSLRLDADLDRMSKLFEDLSQRESELSESEEYGPEQINQQEQIREQMKELSDKIEKMPESSPKRQQERIQEMSEEIGRQMEDLDQQLEQNIMDMQDDQADPSQMQQDQQDMSRQMDQMAQTMSGMRESMQQQTIDINMQALKYILESVILLSEEQEDVLRRTSDLTSNSPGFIEQARRQRNINGQFNMLTDSLYQVSAEIPQFSNKINDRKREIQRHMDRAVDYLIDRDRSRSTSQERLSLGGLNEIGTMVADLLDQLNDMSNGGGEGAMSMQQMMEQMQGMSEEQQQLNEQIQDFINDIAGERLTRDHMERLDQMARQQNQIREQMRELQRRGGLEGDRLMSEMERLSEEMEDAINDMRGGSTDDLMVERQHNILSRMLEVEESVHRRDEDEEERLGETAEDYDEQEIPEMTMEELREEIRSGAESSDFSRFRDDYQRLIERYFQLMEEQMDEPGIRSEN